MFPDLLTFIRPGGAPMAIDKIGKFTILDTLGSGAHSSILHIRRAEDEREYALKLVPIDDKDDLKYLEQAKHEFRVGQMLNHPNLVKVYAFETDSGLVLRPEEGQTPDRVRPRQDDGQARRCSGWRSCSASSSGSPTGSRTCTSRAFTTPT